MNGEVLWHLNDVTGILWHSNSVMLANLAMQLLHMPPEDFAREIVKDAQYHTIQLMFGTMKFTVSQLIHLGETMAKRKHCHAGRTQAAADRAQSTNLNSDVAS
jgi:hypothetical protein